MAAVAGALVAIATAAGCGSDAPGPGTSEATPHSASASQPPAASSRLRIYHRGQPIVWLRRGARVALRTAPGGKLVKKLGWRTRYGSRTVLSVFSHRGRWAGVPTSLLPDGQLGWVKLDASKLRSGWTTFSIDIDLSTYTGQLRLHNKVLRSFTVTIGAPSSPTPTGRFAITDTFRGNLNPAYGCCALATTATQPNLPSGWLGGRTIAIHGTYGPLGVAESHGCVRAPNAVVNTLVNRVPLGAPVVIHQ